MPSNPVYVLAESGKAPAIEVNTELYEPVEIVQVEFTALAGTVAKLPQVSPAASARPGQSAWACSVATDCPY